MEDRKPYRNDLRGQKFNRLTVIEFSHMDKNNGAVWKCLCDCGNESFVATSQISLGHTKSCGCLRLEEANKSNTSHGMHNTKLYRRWASMKRRCKNQDDPIYGGKGIGYDPRWESFENFYKDMHEGFSPELEIDRIDVTKGYSKENCRWANHNENNFNKNIQPNNTSGKTGVSLHKPTGKFRAYITVNRKQINLGLYEHFEDAVSARVAAELEIYGYTRP